MSSIMLTTEQVIKKRKKEFLRELRNIFFIVIILLVFRSVFYEPYRIPSGSMIPTLKIDDFIIVNKFEYGFKVPFSDMAIFDLNLEPIYINEMKKPTRGDVVVFKWPRDPSINYIKRIVGLPGDTLEIREKRLFINGEKVIDREVNGEKFLKNMDAQYIGNKFKFYESKIGDRSFVIQQDVDNVYSNQTEEIKIPKGHYFVLGDNRDYSSDSRFWGFVPAQNIRGRATKVWFSFSRPTGESSFKIRFDRIMKAIK